MTALVIGASQDYFQKKLQKWRQENKNDYEEEKLNVNNNDNYQMLTCDISDKDENTEMT